MKNENKLIAEFMGYTNNFWYHNDQLTYHTSWDKLMPVVEKIQSLNYGFSFKGLPAQDGFGGHTIATFYQAMESRTKHSSGSFIENVYSAVVEFIKWYNEQKTTPPPQTK